MASRDINDECRSSDRHFIPSWILALHISRSELIAGPTFHVGVRLPTTDHPTPLIDPINIIMYGIP
jgi:hypothetical protein